MSKRNIGAAAVLLFLTLNIFWTSCTDVDNSLGSGFIPQNQIMKVYIDTLSGIDAFQTQYDSFPTNNLEFGYFGSRQSDEFGILKAGFISEFVWVQWSDPDVKFGIAPVPDSITLLLGLNDFDGDSSAVRTYNIYRTNYRFDKTKDYYADFDVEPIIDRSNVLFSFEYQGADNISIRMTGENVEKFMKELIDADGSLYEDGNDSLFINKFKGIYIEQAGGPDRSAIMRIKPANSGFELHYRTHTDETAQTVKDTLSVGYTFYNAETTPITTVNTFKHDYTGTNIKAINDTLLTSTPLDVVYVQGLAGVTAMLRFTPEFIQSLRGKIVSPYTKMAINKAELIIPLADPTPENLDMAPLRLGMYSNFRHFVGIVDYTYIWESDYGMTLPFGGNLNRSRGDYRMNISSHMHTILNAPENTPQEDFKVIVGPSVSSNDLFGFTQVILKTGTDPVTGKVPLRLALTYTLIK